MTPWQSRLESYLRLRRSLGFKDAFAGNALRAFVSDLESKGHQGAIRAETAVDWARQASGRCYRTGASTRLHIVRGFLIYLKAFEPETEIPSPRLVAEPRRPKAQLYSQEEILQMMRATHDWFWEPGSFRQKTYRNVVGLLACTGLRIGEALRLTLSQAQLDNDPPYLEIRDTKFYKSRLVPLHPSAAAELRQYRTERTQYHHAKNTGTFFINEGGRPLQYNQVRKAIVHAQAHAGIGKVTGPGRQGPALHALRHTFAVERLLVWYRAGADVRTQLPNLSVYLGHLGMVQTYHYLSATPELLTLAGEMFGRYAGAGGQA